MSIDNTQVFTLAPKSPIGIGVGHLARMLATILSLAMCPAIAVAAPPTLQSQGPSAPPTLNPTGRPEPTLVVWTPQQMISAYIDWLRQQPATNSRQPNVTATYTRVNGGNVAALNNTQGQTDFGRAGLAIQGTSLVGAISFSTSDSNGVFQHTGNFKLVLDSVTGRLTIGSASTALQNLHGILVAESFPFSNAITSIVLSISPGVSLH